ncbi:uncharacterized protein LOC141600897 [Silene latifolia]|uniref:uncharacterized protein LOC141600897 n=1 Tax=Silene latifolia TaxID=37657 RepID=UPI003D77EF28
MDLVTLGWNTPVTGSSMYVLSRKLASARYAILCWVIQHRLSHGINWSSVESKLDSPSDTIVNSFTANTYQTVRSEQLQRIHEQHQYWLQRVKLRKEILDGLPTRFLFNRVKQRSSKQRILALRTSDGTWIHDSADIEMEVTGYFKSLLGPPSPHNPAFPVDNYDPFLNPLDLPSLTSQDCAILSAPFTDMDVLRALRNMEGSKSPGPDGITPRFFQQAFVPGRLMSDSSVIAHEIIHYLNKTKKGSSCYAVLKLDMHKAFDRVSWHFLMEVMRHMRFPTAWRSLIWECISTVYYRILINGEPSSLARAEKMRMLTGLKISRYAPTISHLFYADDALICYKAAPKAFETLRDLFKDFESASGQMINLNKSFIKFSPNSPSDFKSHLTSILKMQSSSTFGTYLGVPIDIPRNRSQVFHPYIDNLTTRISSLSSLHLTQSSKLLVISGVLFASFYHLMAALPFPLGICRKIDSLIAAFWWRHDWKRHSIHWLKRETLQAPKEYGGLGIKNTLLLSQAMLVKNFWRIHLHPNGLLAKYLVPKYGRDLPIPTAKSRVSNSSFLWKGICRAVDEISSGICWKIGNEKQANLFNSRWVQGTVPIRNRTDTEPDPSLLDLLHPSGDWNTSAIFRRFAPATAKLIITMEPPLLDTDDFLYWKYTEDGSYSVKIGYLHLWLKSNTSSSSLKSSFPWSCIWKSPGSLKFPLLLWRLAHNIMPTSANLKERGVSLGLTCHFCGSSEENADHLFRSCNITQHVWQSSMLGLTSHANVTVPFSHWLADLVYYFSHHTSSAFDPLLYFGCVLQASWSVGNSIIFQQCPVDPSRICQLAEHLLSSHNKFPETWSSLAGLFSLPQAPAPSRQPTHNSFESVSFYVLVRRLNPNNGYRTSISDSHTGEEYTTLIRADNMLHASTRALLIAMRKARSAAFTSASFYISCRKLSAVLVRSLPVPISVRNSIHEIRHLFVIYPFWSVSLATG